MSQIPSKRPESAHLERFLARAYDLDRMSDLFRDKMLRAGRELAGVVPLRAHLTKDNRLVVSYSLEVFSPRDHGLQTELAFLHDCALTREPVLKAYRDLDRSATDSHGGHSGNGNIRRSFLRTGEDEFVVLFPRDPGLRTAVRVLRPAAARDLYNEAFAAPDAPAGAEAYSTTGVSIRVLGYRPERRLVVALFPAGSAQMARPPCVLKFSRRGEAERMWSTSRLLADSSPDSVSPCPFAHLPSVGALAYPLVEGETLHTLIEHGSGTPVHLSRTGALLRQFHSTFSGVSSNLPLRDFTFADELGILERWRRFLKQSGSSEHGFVARHLRRLGELAPVAPSPDSLVHRDFYPKQILVHPWTHEQKLIDVDTMAWGPAALDLGNFLAHLDLAEFARPEVSEGTDALRQAFVEGYGSSPDSPDVRLFRYSTLLRLFCLALVGPERRLLIPPVRNAVQKIAEKLL